MLESPLRTPGMDCERLKSAVQEWVGAELECRSTQDSGLLVTLPLLKPNGDAIELSIEPGSSESRWKISDLGDTYATLYLAGVEMFEEYVRAAEFAQIIADYRIVDDKQELSIEVTDQDLAGRLFDFVHALQSMLALQLTVQPRQPKRDFASIVAGFFGEQHASFHVPEGRLAGKTGRWKFDFILNHKASETLVKAVTANRRGQAMRSTEQSVFEILDVREVRPSDAVVIADDEGDNRKQLWRDPQIAAIFEGWKVPTIHFHSDRQALIQLASRYSTKS